MKTVFHARLVNEPFGDPALYVEMHDARRSFLFDCGDLSPLSPREILRVSEIFVSHTHMDHWFGFDRVLRVCAGRDKTLRLFGPAGFIEDVASRVHGYTWNLLGEAEEVLNLVVVELHTDGSAWMSRMRSDRGFALEDPVFSAAPKADAGWVLLDEPDLRVRATVLDHRTPCLAFVLEEKGHIGVRKTELDARGLGTGPWLSDLKRAVRLDAPGDTVVRAQWREDGVHRERFLPLRELRGCLTYGPGQRLGYVVDARGDRENSERIVSLVRGCDHLWIEAPFLERERERAWARYHLTARQAGELAARAGAERLSVFHFSPRHEDEAEELLREAHEAFEGLGGELETAS